MEGARRKDQSATAEADRGRSAETPAEIPKTGWRDIFVRAKKGIEKDHVPIVAGGTAFFILLALVPGLAVLISLYGLISNPSDVQTQLDALSRIIPAEVRSVLEGQMTRISSQHQAAGLAAAVSLCIALWGGASGMKMVMTALNIIYHEEEKRGFFKVTLTALGLTLALIAMGIVSISAIVVVPLVLAQVGLGNATKMTVSLLRWPFLFLVALTSISVVYRYAPSREKPQWKWVSAGALIGTVIWVAGSGLFAFYAQHFGSYNKTYGSLGAIVVLMLWLYLSAFALLIGAEVNANSEEQTAKDTTTGPPQPLGQRGAYVADTVGRSP